MKSLFTKYVWLQLVLSILLLFGGGLIIAFAISGKGDVLKEGLNLVVAVILFIFGLFAILTAFIFESNKTLTNGLLYGSACIALGVFLCIRKLFILEYVVLLLAIFFIVIGVVALGKSILLFAARRRYYMVATIMLLIGAIGITLGIIAIIYESKMVYAFCIVAGVLLVVAGIFEMTMGIKALIGQDKGSKNNKKSSHKTTKKESQQEEIKELDYTKE